MLMNNKFSKRNSLLYKMKCINTRNMEYQECDNFEYGRIEKYNDKCCTRKCKQSNDYFFLALKMRLILVSISLL